MVVEVNEHPDSLDREAEFAGVADETQTLRVALRVVSRVTRGAFRLIEQSGLLIVPKRWHLDPGSLRKRPD